MKTNNAGKVKKPILREEEMATEPELAIIKTIIDARKLSGLTQQQLSEKTGIAQGDISRIERGEANPSLKTLLRLANGMDMKLSLSFTPEDGKVQVKRKAIKDAEIVPPVNEPGQEKQEEENSTLAYHLL